jgi:hypothetical protein
MPTHRKVHHVLSNHLVCAICREPVSLETAKTDDDGKGVHEECYVQKIVGNNGKLDQGQATREVSKLKGPSSLPPGRQWA